MSLFVLPRGAALPRELGTLLDRDIQDKLRRYERAMSAWERKAIALYRATTALQAASDDLVAVADVRGPNARGIDATEAEQRVLLLNSIDVLDRHLFRFE